MAARQRFGSGFFPMKVFQTHTRVRYAETDATGIAYYGSYFVYFEVGRIELFRELGLPYDSRVPIRETYCRYYASARFDDPLLICSTVSEVRDKGFRIGCQVLHAEPAPDPQLFVEGYTVMVTTDEDGLPTELPPLFRDAFRRIGAVNP